MKKYSYTDFGKSIVLPTNGKTPDVEQKEQSVSEGIEKFKELMKNKTTWVTRFTSVKENGDLHLYENGVHILLPNIEVGDWIEKGLEKAGKNVPRYDAAKRVSYLNYQYPLKIVSVDEEKKEVVVSWLRAKMSDRDIVARKIRTMVENIQPERRNTENEVQNEVLRICREGLAEEIAKMSPKTQKNFQKKLSHEMMIEKLEKKGVELVVVPARVVSVDRVGCIINLCNYDIPGYVPKYFWSFGFIDDMHDVVEVNDWIDVAVLAYKTNKEGQSIPVPGKGKGMYLCARTPLIDNPWKEEPFRYTEGDIVRLTCTKVKQHNYFGIIEGSDFEIYCELPNEERGLRIIEGEEYECRIYRINKDTKLIKAKTIKKVKPSMTKV